MPTAKVNGAQIYYEEAGSGPAVILSAGGLQGKAVLYQPVMDGLARENRVIAYDRRFGGRSSSPLVVQTWDLACRDVMGLMDALKIERAYLGGGSFGSDISLGCALRYADRVLAIFPSNVAGGFICDSYLASKLYKSIDTALTLGMKELIDSFDPNDRFGPFVPERASFDPEYRQALESTPPEEYAQVMRNTIYALFSGARVTLGMSEGMLKNIRVPTLVMPGNNDAHPRSAAEQVHRLVPQSQWGEVPPHKDAPEKYVGRVRRFLTEVESTSK